MNLKWIEVSVRIPNLDGDGVAEIKTVRVPVTIDAVTGEELLTEEAVEIIDTTKARELKIQKLQKELANVKGELEILDNNYAVSSLNEGALMKELKELRNICQLRGEIIATALEDGDLGYHDDRLCSEDDTCTCENIAKINKAMKNYDNSPTSTST